MSRQYRTREGSVTAIDTRTQLSTLGSETAPGPLLVPQGRTKIAQVIVAQASNQAAAASYSALVRLEGPGLPEGPEVFAVGAGGVPVATGGNGVNPAIKINVDIPVTPANEILVFGEMAGADAGALEMAVTLVFE
jgi:hypothetical protein